ncbi:MAG: amino acid permease [Gemmatimonadetes bacterium]|nr:amino acid permease [Gemmatimonadota bacterium]
MTDATNGFATETPSGHDRNGRLVRRLGVWSAAAVLVGSTIGSGIFRVPSVAAAQVDSLGAFALVWMVGAALSLFGALTLAELAALFPHSGGIYVFLREGYGPLPAFLFGWTRLVVLHPASIGAIAMIFAAYVGAFLPLEDVHVRIIAASVIAALAAANYRSVGWGAAIQNASTAAKVLSLGGLALLALAMGDAGAGAFAQPPTLAPSSWTGFGIALVAVLWTYDGWADLTYMAGEVKNPTRTLPRALIGGVLAVVLVYLAVNAAYLYVLPMDAVAASDMVAADATATIFGQPGRSVAAALVMLSTFGAINGTLMTGPRIFYAMADDNLFFRRVAAVHPRFRTPHIAIILAAALGIGYVSIRTFEQLAAAFVLGIWPFYALAVGAVFRLRRRRELQPPYRTPGYPLVPILFLLSAIAILANALVEQPGSTLLGFAIILAGIPVYYARRAYLRRHSAQKLTELAP